MAKVLSLEVFILKKCLKQVFHISKIIVLFYFAIFYVLPENEAALESKLVQVVKLSCHWFECNNFKINRWVRA